MCRHQDSESKAFGLEGFNKCDISEGERGRQNGSGVAAMRKRCVKIGEVLIMCNE